MHLDERLGFEMPHLFDVERRDILLQTHRRAFHRTDGIPRFRREWHREMMFPQERQPIVCQQVTMHTMDGLMAANKADVVPLQVSYAPPRTGMADISSMSF